MIEMRSNNFVMVQTNNPNCALLYWKNNPRVKSTIYSMGGCTEKELVRFFEDILKVFERHLERHNKQMQPKKRR